MRIFFFAGNVMRLPVLLKVMLCSIVVSQFNGCVTSRAPHGPAESEAGFLILAQLEGLRDGMDAIRERVAALEINGQRRTADNVLPQSINLLNRTLDVSDLPGRGLQSAPVAIIEVTDYQCPYCRAHYQQTLAGIESSLVEPGLVRYYIYDYPLPGHELAPLAALSANCAGRQHRFWEFHDALFELGNLQDDGVIERIATDQRLDLAEFRACQQESAHESRLNYLKSLAEGFGIGGTPSFIIGLLGPDQRVSELTLLQGLHSVEQFSTRVQRYLGR